MKSGTFAKILLAFVVMFFISVTILFLPGMGEDEKPAVHARGPVPAQQNVEQVTAPPTASQKLVPTAASLKRAE